MKIVLIIVAIVVGLGILGVCAAGFVAWRVSKAVHVNQATGEVSVNTPQGTISASTKETFTASDLGIDIYPGAEPIEGGLRMATPDGSMITGLYVTADSQDQVVSFYKDKAGEDGGVMETGSGAMITVKKEDKESIVITVSPNSSSHGGKTQISIVHTVNNKSA